MTKTLKSNWMFGTDKSPILFRAATKGKPMSRDEKIAMLNFEQARKEATSDRKAMIQAERNRITEEKQRRERVLQGIAARLSDPKAKLRSGSDGVFLQSRDSKGHFTPKMEL